MRASVLLSALALLFTLAGCDSGPTEPVNISGSWTGSVTVNSVEATATLSLRQTGSTVTGTVDVNGFADAATLTGEIDGSRFTWTAQAASCILVEGITDVTGSNASIEGTVTFNGNACPQPTIVRGPLILTRR